MAEFLNETFAGVTYQNRAVGGMKAIDMSDQFKVVLMGFAESDSRIQTDAFPSDSLFDYCSMSASIKGWPISSSI